MNYLKVAAAEAFGILFLWLPCLLQEWTEATVPSTKPYPSGTSWGNGKVMLPPYRPLVDAWRWDWLNAWYGNNEDGVSGRYAYIWVGGKLVPYSSTFPSWVPARVIAYCWSALRNGAHAVKLSTGYEPAPTQP